MSWVCWEEEVDWGLGVGGCVMMMVWFVGVGLGKGLDYHGMPMKPRRPTG